MTSLFAFLRRVLRRKFTSVDIFNGGISGASLRDFDMSRNTHKEEVLEIRDTDDLSSREWREVIEEALQVLKREEGT